MYFYRASAVGLGGTITTPSPQIVEPQATASLPVTGGHVSQRVEKFNAEGLVSFELAYLELTGTFDSTNNVHRTVALSVVEGLNISDIVTVDRVVARIAVVSPEQDSQGEHSFDIIGSHFENLRVAGHPIEVTLATQRLSQLDTYSKFEKVYSANEAMDLLPWGNQTDKRLGELEQLEKQYCKAPSLAKSGIAWKKQGMRRSGGSYWCSAAGHLNIESQLTNSELRGFGGIILVPRVGLIYLAELLIDKSTRQFNMLRVELDSPRRGSIVAGNTAVNGTADPIPISAPPVLNSRSSQQTDDDDSDLLGRQLTRELLLMLRSEGRGYVSRKRDIYIVDVEIAVQDFGFLFRTAENLKVPLFCFKADEGPPIPIAALPPQVSSQSFSIEPWTHLRNVEDINLDVKDRARLQLYSPNEARDFFAQRLEEFLIHRLSARQSDISELPGLPVRVTTRSHGLRAYYSPAYFFDGTRVLNGPTTPTVGWIQPGTYIFGAGHPGKPASFDFSGEYQVPAGSDRLPPGEYKVSTPTEVSLKF